MTTLSLVEQREQVSDANARLGTAYFLLAEGVFFVGLVFFAWFIRNRFPSWPPPGAPTPQSALLLGNVLLLLASAMLAVAAGRAAQAGRAGWAQLGFLAALATGGLFLFGQWSEYLRLGGWQPRDNMFRTLFDSLAALHGAHVAMGLVLLAIVFTLLRMGSGGSTRRALVRASVWYWVFVAFTWPVLLAVLTIPA
jgi:cytochrome c oxidase subunit 3